LHNSKNKLVSSEELLNNFDFNDDLICFLNKIITEYELKHIQNNLSNLIDSGSVISNLICNPLIYDATYIKNLIKLSDKDNGLILASYLNNEQIVEKLLENKANVNAINFYGNPILVQASNDGKYNLVNILLKYGANTEAKLFNHPEGTTSLLIASSKGHFKIVDILLQYKANIEATGMNGNTSLLIASSKGDFKIVDILLKYKANIKATDTNGNTSLMFASQEGKKDIVELLISNKADVNAKNNKGETSLKKASENGHESIVELLRVNGAIIE